MIKANGMRVNLDKKVYTVLSTKSTNFSLRSTLLLVATKIIQGDCIDAREILKCQLANNLENPEIYNLFGISYEVERDLKKSSKFYRVAYYMDQTFEASEKNLNRVCELSYKKDINLISWGIDLQEVIK